MSKVYLHLSIAIVGLRQTARWTANVVKAPLSTNATLNSGEDEKVYYGSCATTFKARFNNYTHSFREQHKRNTTELSKAAVWNCKDAKIEPLITWSIVYRAPPYRNGAKRCPLCLAEKLFILQADQKSLLHKRSELISKCRHRNKFKLKNLK